MRNHLYLAAAVPLLLLLCGTARSQLGLKQKVALPGPGLYQPVDQHVATDGSGNSYTAAEYVDSSGNHGISLTKSDSSGTIWTQTIISANPRSNPHVVLLSNGVIELFLEVTFNNGNSSQINFF